LHQCTKNLKDVFDYNKIHAGQHYDFELSEIFFSELGIPPPNRNLEVGSGLAGFQVGGMIKKIERVLMEDKFEMVIVYGDTNSTFSGAFAVINNGIRVAHLESGLRSFDRRIPEETNRELAYSISNYLFTSTNSAVRNLEKENVYGKIFDTRDLPIEIVSEVSILESYPSILSKFNLNPKDYILL
jgi:UDP-GlcNAc3NAcA epimerase